VFRGENALGVKGGGVGKDWRNCGLKYGRQLLKRGKVRKGLKKLGEKGRRLTKYGR